MNLEVSKHLLYISRCANEELLAGLAEQGWQVSMADSLREAQRILSRELPSVGLFDFTCGHTAQQLAAFEPLFGNTQVSWISTVDEPQLGERAIRHLIRRYFFDFITLPRAAPRVIDAIEHARGMTALHHLDTEPVNAAGSVADTTMVGTCEAMLDMFRAIAKVSNTDAPVLIYGESGTGKELTAAAIHQRSIRRKGPFVAINCGAIPHDLLQSELFGHERGAFTGAQQRKIGHVEAAHGGTLFLDEIGDLPLESQVSLLRFLQERKIQRLGSHEPIPVDVRVISATHVKLEDAVRRGAFRADLYHRLCVLRLVEPPLRARGPDIEILAHHMLDRYRTDNTRRIRGFSDAAIRAMYDYDWPGNIRELINRVRRAIVMTEGRVITPADLELEVSSGPRACTLVQAREAAERRVIEDALFRHRHRLNQAARELGVSRATLYRLMQAHGLRERGVEPAAARPVAAPTVMTPDDTGGQPDDAYLTEPGYPEAAAQHEASPATHTAALPDDPILATPELIYSKPAQWDSEHPELRLHAYISAPDA